MEMQDSQLETEVSMERGDRVYVGVYAEGPNTAGYASGVHVSAQGGFF